MKRSAFENTTTYVELTEKGKALAVHLQDAEKVLSDGP